MKSSGSKKMKDISIIICDKESDNLIFFVIF